AQRPRLKRRPGRPCPGGAAASPHSPALCLRLVRGRVWTRLAPPNCRGGPSRAVVPLRGVEARRGAVPLALLARPRPTRHLAALLLGVRTRPAQAGDLRSDPAGCGARPAT